MRLDNIDASVILGSKAKRAYQYEKEEEQGFWGKLFGKKKNYLPPFESELNRIGEDVIIAELSDSNNAVGYSVDKNQTDIFVILTENYLILPEQDIIELDKIVKYGLFNSLNPDFAQYAEDRMGIPYDPNYVSEYEGEETYELDRFNVLFAFVDKYNLIFKYTLRIEVSDRREFYDELTKRLEDKVDWTSRYVLEGTFEPDSYDTKYYDMIS